MVTEKTYKDLKPVLVDKDGKGVKSAYYEIEDGQSIFVVSPGYNGVEFNKTIGFFSNFPGMQTYFCLYGSGVLLMQRNDPEGEAKEFKVVMFSPLKQVSVPVGWGMCLVNTGGNYLVVLRSTPLPKKNTDSKAVLDKGGFAYFVIEKKGEVVFEPNPKYRVHPQIATE